MDVEIAVDLAGNVDPQGGARRREQCNRSYAAALEIVDLAPVLGSAEAVVATNVFHRAVAFAPSRPTLPEVVRAPLA
jgi:hypothetical protein